MPFPTAPLASAVLLALAACASSAPKPEGAKADTAPSTPMPDVPRGAPLAPDAPARLVVRVDDMGALHGVNVGIRETYRNGIATTVEVIAAGPWFPEAARMLNEDATVDVGLHLAFTSEWEHARWRPITHAPGLVDADGYFFPFIWKNKNFPEGSSLLEAHPEPDLAQIEAEARAQIELLKKYVPRASHITGHMGCSHATKAVRALVDRLAGEYGMAIDLGAAGAKSLPFATVKWPGSKGSAAEKEHALVAALEALGPGTWELIDHPATDDAEMRAITHRGYENVAADRAGVTYALTSPRVREVIARRGIRLVSYRDVGSGR